MDKIITQDQIQVVLQTVLSTNISWQNGETLKKFFASLPSLPEKEKEVEPAPEKTDGNS